MSFDFAGLWSIIAGFLVVICSISLIIAILSIIAQWIIFAKAKQPGWAAIIPIYNTYIACKLTGVNPWWILIVILSPIFAFVPVVGWILPFAICLYFQILLNVGLARAFHKEDAFAIGLILLPVVFLLIIALGKTKYVGSRPMRDFIFDDLLKKI